MLDVNGESCIIQSNGVMKMKEQLFKWKESIDQLIEHRHFEQYTSIQKQAIPQILKGRDVIGISATGTGKSHAFILPDSFTNMHQTAMILAYVNGKDNPDRRPWHMREIQDYPENRLDVRMDEHGNITYIQNSRFARYYAPTRADRAAELEELKERLELLEIDEPADLYSEEYDDWEEEKQCLLNEIEDLEKELEET